MLNRPSSSCFLFASCGADRPAALCNPSCAWLAAAIILGSASFASSAEPRVLIDGCRLELIAREPEIVTPIGATFDSRGRLLVVESHTHQRPADYQGPPGDRIRMLADSDGDGRLDRWSNFAEGFQNGANIVPGPAGSFYFTTRNDLRRLEDGNDDGVADKDALLLHLETKTDYPHNGLSAMALDSQGQIYVALAENFGAEYKLTGSDGAAISGGGGVGTVFRCRADGSHLERFAFGFWNIFTMCRLDNGDLIAVDNDPDSCPSSRMVHLVEGGDYGFRYEYGRSGIHPLQAWDGELPGTLPMICGTGEAPTAVVQHRGYLWLTSWGDHRIERYRLAPRGASFTATRDVVVQGDDDFRPTGMAVAPDGSLYFGDWVDKSYPVHGKGKIWRLTLAKELADAEALAPAPSKEQKLASSNAGVDRDPFARQKIVADILHNQPPAQGPEAARGPDRLAVLQAARFRQIAESDALKPLRTALADADSDVRLYAVRWIADERIAVLRDAVAALLDGDIPDDRYYLAVLAALDWLDGDATMRAGTLSDGLLGRELKNDRRPVKIRALALRLLSPDHPTLTLDRLHEFLNSPESALQIEAVRKLAMRSQGDQFELLAEVTADNRRDAGMRADAIAGLAKAAGRFRKEITEAAESGDPAVTLTAQRVLTLTGLQPRKNDGSPPATDLAAWNELLGAGGDPAAGRRLFFMPAGPQCAACHQHRGQGGRIGPDLSQIGRTQSRERIIASILQPSREMAPQFQPWTLVTKEGKALIGLRLPKAGDDGVELYADSAGARFTLRSDEIELRKPCNQSMMPEGLQRTLDPAALRDVIAFLREEE